MKRIGFFLMLVTFLATGVAAEENTSWSAVKSMYRDDAPGMLWTQASYAEQSLTPTSYTQHFATLPDGSSITFLDFLQEARRGCPDAELWQIPEVSEALNGDRFWKEIFDWVREHVRFHAILDGMVAGLRITVQLGVGGQCFLLSGDFYLNGMTYFDVTDC